MGIGPAENGRDPMSPTFRDIIVAGEYEHYGVRAHRGDAPVVGQTLGNSRVWVDGECTDDELAGICTLRVTADTLDAAIAQLAPYIIDGEPVVLVGGYYGEHGWDDGEFIIRDNVCLAVA